MVHGRHVSTILRQRFATKEQISTRPSLRQSNTICRNIGPVFSQVCFQVNRVDIYCFYIRPWYFLIGNLRSFWRHEWLKHGTCASQIRELNDELKYFSRTLSWLHRFPMSTILRDANIRPDSNSIRATDVFDAIFKALGTRPNIECVRDQQGNSYLNGIRTCYSKELHLVDCPGRTSLYPTRHYGNSNDFDKVLYIFNCGRRDDFIRFPSVVPATTAK